MIGSLQSLRGIFAIFIFLHHISLNGESLFPAGGPCGVSFFFILSGFVMCAGWEAKIDKGKESKTKLFLRRIIRVYPLHILCFTIVLLLSITHLSSLNLFALGSNLLLIQSWFPIQSIYFSGNALSWCLCDLMFFYLVFPFIIELVDRHKTIACRLFVLLVMFFIGGIICIPEDKAHSLLYINPVFRLVDFIIGISLWQVWLVIRGNSRIKKSFSSLSKATIDFIEISTILLLCLSLILSARVSKVLWYDADIYWWMSLGILILVFTFFNKSGGVLDILLNNKYLVLFGNSSFSFYMIHMICLQILNKIYHLILGDYNVLLMIIPSFIIISGIALWIYRCYETPVSNYFIKRLKRYK